MAERLPDRLRPASGSRLAVGVSRTPAVAGPAPALRPGREVRPEHVDEGHGAVAELLVEAAYDRRGEQRELGGPGRRVGADDELAVGEATRACSARRPRRRPARASGRRRPRTRSSSSQPWSATSRSTWSPSSCGSRSSGCAPETLASRGRSSRLARRLRAAGVDFAVARVSCRARSSPSSSRGLGLVGRLVSHRGSPRPSATTYRTPASAAGTSSGTAAVTSTCSAPATRSASCARRSLSSSAKTSSRMRIGSSPSDAQQVVRREPERERERPGLAVRGVALHRQPACVAVLGAVPEPEQQLVAVRADQRDAAVELVLPAAFELGEDRGRRAGRSSGTDDLYSISASSREAPRATVS